MHTIFKELKFPTFTDTVKSRLERVGTGLIGKNWALSIWLEKPVRIFRQMEQYTIKGEKGNTSKGTAFFFRKHSTGMKSSIWILPEITENSSQMNMNINESCRRFLILFWRMSEIFCSLTPFSVDKLVSLANHKINGFLSFMERMDCLRLVDMMNSLWRGN